MNLFNILAVEGCGKLEPIVKFIKLGVLPIIQIGIPILLILMGTIDLGKAVLSSDDKEIKASTTRLLKRAIAAVAVFFAVTLVNAVMGLVGRGEESGDEVTSASWGACWNSLS